METLRYKPGDIVYKHIIGNEDTIIYIIKSKTEKGYKADYIRRAWTLFPVGTPFLTIQKNISVSDSDLSDSDSEPIELINRSKLTRLKRLIIRNLFTMERPTIQIK